MPILQTAEEAKIEVEVVCDHKLKVLDEILPDPVHFKGGWLSEEESVKYWSIKLYPDILTSWHFAPVSFLSKDLSDYNTSKAYSYYSKSWFSPLKYHSIRRQSKLCIFSQRANHLREFLLYHTSSGFALKNLLEKCCDDNRLRTARLFSIARNML